MSEGLTVDLDHRRGDFRLRAAFAAPPGVTALFGRSGAGKTTLVDLLGGLVRPERGRVEVGGTVLLDTDRRIDLPRHRRRIGYVFQDARLLPHLSVRQNLLFGRFFAPRGGSGPDLDAVLDLLGIAHLLARRPAGLSGGERQRVAIGRALLSKPRLLLMDEPLASLDAARKAEILPYIERLRDEAGIPIVYVSHSLPEVTRLADTVVVLEGGRVTAAGPTGEILTRLDLPGLSATRDAGAVLEATVVRHDAPDDLTALSTRAGELLVPILDLAVGAPLRVQVHARDVTLSVGRPDGVSALNILAGRIAAIGEASVGDPSLLVRLDCAGASLLARLTRRSLAELNLTVGSEVFAMVKSVSFESGRDHSGRLAWPA